MLIFVCFFGLVFFFDWEEIGQRQRIWWEKNCSSRSGVGDAPPITEWDKGVCSSFMCKISNGFPCKFCPTQLLNTRKGIYLPAAYCPRMLSLWISSPVRMSEGHPGAWQTTAAHQCVCVCWASCHTTAEPEQLSLPVHQTNPIQLWAAREESPGWWAQERTRLCWHGQAALPAQRTSELASARRCSRRGLKVMQKTGGHELMTSSSLL